MQYLLGDISYLILLLYLLKDELLGLADSPDSDQVFKNHGLNMDILYRTGETQQVILYFLLLS